MANYIRHIRLSVRTVLTRTLRTEAKPIGYIGWLGFSNLGDQVLYDAVQNLLRPTRLIEFSAAREALIGRMGLSGRMHLQAILLGGGTLIAPGFLKPVSRALGLRLPMFSFGSGVGSSGFGDEPYPCLSDWREPLQRFEMISVRGPRSCETLTAMGLRNVEIIGDPALSHGPSALPPLRDRPTLVINLAAEVGARYGSGSNAWEREVAKIASEHVRKGGELIPVALGKGDTKMLKGCLRDAGLDGIKVQRPRTGAEFINLVSGSHVLIGVRLHSAVLATTVGIIPVMIAYRDKCWDFMESVHLEDLTVDLRENAGRAIREAYEKALAQAFERRPVMFSAVQSWRVKQANYASRVVDRLCSGEQSVRQAGERLRAAQIARPYQPRMETPLVTVAIPMYNGEHWIGETLTAASRQTYQNLEVLVIDDGSSDDGVKIAEDFCGRDQRIRLIRQKNAGACAARNRALEAATGDFFAPLDQDDLWHPEKIRLQVEAFQGSRAGAGMVYTWCSAIDAQGNILCRNAGTGHAEGSVLLDFAMSNPITSGSVALFRTSVIRQLGGYRPECNPVDDIDLYIRVAEKFDVLVLKQFLVGYRVHDRNVSNDQAIMVGKYEELTRDLQRRRPDLPPQLFRWTAANSRFHYGLMALRAEKKALATRLLGSALLLDPFLLERILEIFTRKLKGLFRAAPDGFRGRSFLSIATDEGVDRVRHSTRWDQRKTTCMANTESRARTGAAPATLT